MRSIPSLSTKINPFLSGATSGSCDPTPEYLPHIVKEAQKLASQLRTRYRFFLNVIFMLTNLEKGYCFLSIPKIGARLLEEGYKSNLSRTQSYIVFHELLDLKLIEIKERYRDKHTGRLGAYDVILTPLGKEVVKITKLNPIYKGKPRKSRAKNPILGVEAEKTGTGRQENRARSAYMNTYEIRSQNLPPEPEPIPHEPQESIDFFNEPYAGYGFCTATIARIKTYKQEIRDLFMARYEKRLAKGGIINPSAYMNQIMNNYDDEQRNKRCGTMANEDTTQNENFNKFQKQAISAKNKLISTQAMLDELYKIEAAPKEVGFSYIAEMKKRLS